MFRIQRRTVADTFIAETAGVLAGAGGFRAAGTAADTRRVKPMKSRDSTISV